MAFKINNPFTSRYSNSNIPRGMQKMESNTPLFNHEVGHSGNTKVERETKTTKSYTPGNLQNVTSTTGSKCNPNSASADAWYDKRLDTLLDHFKKEDGSIDRGKGYKKLKEYHKFRNGYKKRKGINKSTNLNPCKNTQLFEQWIRIEGKTDPEFAYNYMDSFYEKYKPKKHDEWKEINKGLLTTIIEQRDITTTTNKNQRPGYEERWEEIVEDDGTYKGMNFEEWKEESIQYNIDNPTSSSTSTDRNVGDWKIVSEETEEIN